MPDNLLLAMLQDGPKLSSILAKELEITLGITGVAARKRIERAKTAGDLDTLENLRFRRNEQFLYLPDQFGTDPFRKTLLDALEYTKSSYRFPLRGIAARGGIVPTYLASTFSGLPIEKRFSSDASTVLSELLSLKLIEEVENSSGRCIQLAGLFGSKTPSEKRLAGRLAAEELLLAALGDWLRLQGFATSFASRNDRNPLQFGFYQWDLVAPSYILPFVTKDKARVLNGFIVADVILGRILTLQDVEYFVNKSMNIKAKPNNRPFVPYLIADWFEKDAFALGRKHGLIFTTPKNFFGSQFALFLDLLVQESEGRAEDDFQVAALCSLSGSLQNFQHLSTAFAEIKRLLLSLIVGHCLRKTNSGNLTYEFQSDPFLDNASSIDLLLTEPGSHAIAIECKHIRLIDVGDLQCWLNQTVSGLYKKFLTDRWYKNAQLTFCFWTTGSLTEEAWDYVNSMQEELPYELSVKDRAQLGEYVNRLAEPPIRQAFNRWYLEHF